MRTFNLIGLFLFVLVKATYAQGDYLVKTATQSSTSGTEEEQFVANNFPMHLLCDWQPGMKFMFVVESRQIIPVLQTYDGERDVDNGKMQFKILEFKGTEEKEKESYVGKSYSTRFVFESEGMKYYHEVKNKTLADICANGARTVINGLAYLGDVDKARELLNGMTLYTKVNSARVDDSGSSNGYREVAIPVNMEVTITAIGVGSRECPVKIVFQDKDGKSYFREQVFSRTNSGLADSDLKGANIYKPFSNAFSFADTALKGAEDLKKKYIGRDAYPQRSITVDKNGSPQEIQRYTQFVIDDIAPISGGTKALLTLSDKAGAKYTMEIDLKYNVITRNEDYIDDVFGYGNLRTKYPSTTDETWNLIAKGEVKVGMTKDECRLSLGPAVRIADNLNSNYSTWYYYGKVLEFSSGKLTKIK